MSPSPINSVQDIVAFPKIQNTETWYMSPPIPSLFLHYPLPTPKPFPTTPLGYVRKRSGLLLHRRHHPSRIHENQLLKPLVHVGAVLDALPGGDAGLVHVEVEEADFAVEAAVARVAAEPDATAVAHPESRFPVFCMREAAVFVYVIAAGSKLA